MSDSSEKPVRMSFPEPDSHSAADNPEPRPVRTVPGTTTSVGQRTVHEADSAWYASMESALDSFISEEAPGPERLASTEEVELGAPLRADDSKTALPDDEPEIRRVETLPEPLSRPTFASRPPPTPLPTETGRAALDRPAAAAPSMFATGAEDTGGHRVPVAQAAVRGPTLARARPEAAAEHVASIVRTPSPVSVSTSHAARAGAPATGAARPRSASWRRAIVAGLIATGLLLGAVSAWRLASRAWGTWTGALSVTSRPAGAQVLIDGQPQGVTPLSLRLAPGEHTLEIHSAGPTQVMPLHIEKGRQIVRDFHLAVGAAPATLRVDTKVAGARVLIDGRVRGRSPAVVAGLNPGTHSVRVERGSQSTERTVMLESGVNGMLSLPIESAPAGSSGKDGWVSVAAPIEIKGYEEGRMIGSSRAVPLAAAGRAARSRVRQRDAGRAGQTSGVGAPGPNRDRRRHRSTGPPHHRSTSFNHSSDRRRAGRFRAPPRSSDRRGAARCHRQTCHVR